MNSLTLAAALAVLTGGAFLAVQAPLNAALARTLGDPLLAACASFGVGFAILLALCLLRGGWPSLDAAAAAPWWAWAGGGLGAAYVTFVIWSVPRLGVTTTVAAMVLGQVAAALVLDRIGAFGLPVHAITWQRIAAAGLVLAGLVLSRGP
jgi:transporter family-2 protein